MVVVAMSVYEMGRIGMRAVSSIDGPAFGGGGGGVEEEALESEPAERGRAADCDEDGHASVYSPA